MPVRNAAVWNGSAQNLGGTDQVNVNGHDNTLGNSYPGLMFDNRQNTGLAHNGNDVISIYCAGARRLAMGPTLGPHLTLLSVGTNDSQAPHGFRGRVEQLESHQTASSSVGGNANGLWGEAVIVNSSNHAAVGVVGYADVGGSNGVTSHADELAAFRGECEVGSLADPNTDQHSADTVAVFWAMPPSGNAFDQFYGFYCQGLNASTDVRWAFYHDGTAPSYFGGSVQIGTDTVGTGTNVLVIADGTAPSSNITGACQVYTDSGDLFCRTATGGVFKLTGGGAPQTSVTKTNGEAVSIDSGMVVYSFSSTSVKRAKADSTLTKDAIGFVANTSDVAASGSAAIQTDGIITLANWTDALNSTTADGTDLGGGVYGLQAGRVYYTSSTNAGKITITPPSSAGTFVAPVGLALSTTEMLVYTSLAQVVATTPSVATTRPNSLLNGGFDFFQRTAPGSEIAIANNAYGPDRWVCLNNGTLGDLGITRVAGSTNARYAGRFKQFNATAKKFGILQVIEASNTIPLRQKEVRVQATLKASTSPWPVRMAVLEWTTGTADTLGASRDVIANWANSADSNPATSFFKSTNFIVRGYTDFIDLNTSFQQIGLNVTVGSTANNLIVVIWNRDAMGQAGYIDVTEAGVYVGTTNPVIWTPIPISDELARCNRYYQKSYTIDLPPGSQTLAGCIPPARAFDVDNLTGTLFTTVMRVPPSISIYSALGNLNKISTWPAAADNGGSVDSVQYPSQRGFLYVQSIADFNTTTPYFYHWVADAEL